MLEKPETLPWPTLPSPLTEVVADAGRIRFGAGYRLPAPVPPEIADTGRIAFGAGYRIPG